MTTALPGEPSPQALSESLAALAAQLADLRGQIRAINDRLDQAGLHPGLNLAVRFEDLAQTVADTLDAASPRGPAAPSWIGLDRDTYVARLADLRQWADTVLRPHYGGYELADCWPRHIHAVWELSTLAAEWHRTYSGTRPDLARALEFYDRWLPGTMRTFPTSPGRACRNACCSAALVTGLIVPDTASTRIAITDSRQTEPLSRHHTDHASHRSRRPATRANRQRRRQITFHPGTALLSYAV